MIYFLPVSEMQQRKRGWADRDGQFTLPLLAVRPTAKVATEAKADPMEPNSPSLTMLIILKSKHPKLKMKIFTPSDLTKEQS